MMSPAHLLRWLPFMAWWGRVDRRTLRADFGAGLTGSLILVPQAMAFATIAGMPPAYGLYAAMVPVVVSALFGSSWHLVSGPTTAMSIVVFASLSPLAEPGSPHFVQLALTLSLWCGVFKLALGGLRMGGLMNFVSHTVVVGFIAGAAVLIAASQLRNAFGLTLPRGAGLQQQLLTLVTQPDSIRPWVLMVALATLLTGLLARRWFTRLPYLITALLCGSLLAAALNAGLGPARTGIATLEALPRGFPPLSMPDLTWATMQQLLPVAMALALLSMTEALSIARALALRTGQRLDSNQDLIGQGLGNVVGAFFSAYPSSGSFNRSGLNLAAGARTPLAAVFSALLLLAIVQFVAPAAAYLPLAAMAGVLFLVAWGLVDFGHIRHILRSDRQESAVLVTSFLATLFLRLEFAVFVGALLALLLYLNRTSRPVIEDVKPAAGDGQYHFTASTSLPDCPQLKILRVNGSMFFGATPHVQAAMTEVDERTPSQKFLLLACPGVNFVDLAGAQMLAQEARRRRLLGGDLYLFALREGPVDALQRSGQLEAIGRDHVLPMGHPALLGAIIPRLDAAVCASCTRRVFQHCPTPVSGSTTGYEAPNGSEARGPVQ